MSIEAITSFGNIIFKEFDITVCWVLWTARNRPILDHITCSMNNWKARFREEIGLICIKVKPNLAGSLNMFMENLT